MKIVTRRHVAGGTIWYKENVLFYWHREDGPACIMDDGDEEWYYHGYYFDNPKKMPLNLFLAYCKWEYNKQ